jgi:hypothetical protein
MKTNKLRCLKIVSRHTSKLNAANYAQPVPSIVLTGLWLNDAGFHSGEKVVLIVGDGRILIETVKNK